MHHVGSGGGPIWKVSIQRDRGQAASCTCCKNKFDAGAVRISRARASAQRYVHADCLGVSLGRAADLEGFQSLPPELAAVIEPCLTQEGDVVIASSQNGNGDSDTLVKIAAPAVPGDL